MIGVRGLACLVWPTPVPLGYRRSMDAVSLGKAGLQGWRAKVGDAVAEPIAQRSPLTDDQVRAVVGGLFFVLSVVYVVGTVWRVVRKR